MANYKAGSLSVEFFGIDKTLSTTLDNIIARLEKFEKVTSNISKGGKGNGKDSFMSKFTLGFAYGKIRAITGALTRMARFTSQILQHGVDYTETLNLWQVAMGDNLSMAQDFVTQMNKAYGISEKTLMNAQAIFKNMIGSLGQISDTMAYNLSEAITQMAIDYASLYNVSINSAITKFQAALAGQVRPIRSVSGYDITENTLYQLYQSIGGTKTMRQLSRTEKQLLSILAIYQQMGASGALGDMEKTIDQVANQSRMMTENWEQMATWAGVSLQYSLQQMGAFQTINALLITGAEIFKSIAYSLGYETPDFANSWAENVEDTEKAVDDLQGKLLDFDKFRSLSGTEQNVLGIDTKLMEAISGYTSNIGNAVNESRKLAEEWLKTLGFVDENGDGVYEITQRAKDLGETLKIVGIFLGIIFGKAILNSILKFGKGIAGITSGSKLLSTVLLTGVIYAITKAIEAFDDGDIAGGILATTIGVALVGAWVLLNREMLKTIGLKVVSFFTSIGSAIETWIIKLMIAIGAGNTFKLAVWSMTGAMAGLTASVMGALALIQNWGDMNTWQRIIGVIGVATTAILGLAMAFGVFHSARSMGLATAGIVAGIAMIVGSMAGVKKDIQQPVNYMANGGLPDKGTMFVAGEAGAEIVYNTPSGQSGVVNVKQIEQAMYGALIRYGNSNSGKIELTVNLDGEKVYQNTTARAKKHGNGWSKA